MVFTPSSLIRVYGLFGFAIYNLAEVCMLMHVCVRTHTYEWVHTWLHLCIVMAQITWSLFPSHCGFMKALIFCHLARGRAMLGIGPHGLLEWKRCSSGKLQRCFRRNWKERIKGVGESYFRINPREGLWDFEEIWMYTREIHLKYQASRGGHRFSSQSVLLEVTWIKTEISWWSFLEQLRVQVPRDRQAGYIP